MHAVRSTMLILAIAMSPLLTACEDPGAIAYEEGNEVHWAGLENVPPGSARTTKTVADLGNWNLDHLSLAPNGGWLAIGLRTDDNPSAGILDTRVRVYNSVRTPADLVVEWDEQDLKEFIEDNANLSYPQQLVDFNPIRLSWMDNSHLLINVQPIISGTSIESIPENVALVVAFQADSVTDGPSFYGRGGTSPIVAPDHPQKTAFTTENRSGTLFVDGSQVNGIPTGVGEKFDFVYLGN